MQAEIQTSFECLQKNVDNKVSVEECVRGGKLIGIQMTVKEALKMISQINTDGKGLITYEQYGQLMHSKLKKTEKEKAMQLANFRKYDKDGNGSISFDELKLVLGQQGYGMTEKAILEHFNNADTDGDGEISFNEFVKYFCEI
ncbi:calmodulin-like isoform X2 [Mytilus trossulus]|uniref:calmodulin-like isoform X2 n=1 Tax=Mytilus trossulus TaxID=6551 RepID=UPI003003BBFA